VSENKVEINKEESRFEIVLDGHIAMIEFLLNEGKNHIILTHTEVPPEYSGQGIAASMAKYALEFADTNNLKVTSLCSYIDTYIKRNPEYEKLLK
jgi:predicted GNAT family acetyltransferase